MESSEMTSSKKFLFLCLAVMEGIAMSSMAKSTPASLVGVQRIVFLGDSITQAGGYVADVECWLLAQGREASARAAKSEAEGEAAALRAEVAALTKLVQREAQSGHQLLDLLQVEAGFEAAIGAALADDLRAPEVAGDRPSGWVVLAGYDEAQELPAGVQPLSAYVKAPAVLARRMA